jgi:hypothetical protein
MKRSTGPPEHFQEDRMSDDVFGANVHWSVVERLKSKPGYSREHGSVRALDRGSKTLPVVDDAEWIVT